MPWSMVGCAIRSATKKNGQNGTDRSNGAYLTRSRQISRVLPPSSGSSTERPAAMAELGHRPCLAIHWVFGQW
jgi:hypothetical protein